jgi:hypothetical protein
LNALEMPLDITAQGFETLVKSASNNLKRDKFKVLLDDLVMDE